MTYAWLVPSFLGVLIWFVAGVRLFIVLMNRHFSTGGAKSAAYWTCSVASLLVGVLGAGYGGLLIIARLRPVWGPWVGGVDV